MDGLQDGKNISKYMLKINVFNHKFIKHASTRWLMFGEAASRLLEQWNGLENFYLKHIPSSKDSKTLKNHSYKKIIDYLKNPYIKSELILAKSSGELFTKFTETFKRNEPLLHMLFVELNLIVQTLASRVIKLDILQDIQKSVDFAVDLANKYMRRNAFE